MCHLQKRVILQCQLKNLQCPPASRKLTEKSASSRKAAIIIILITAAFADADPSILKQIYKKKMKIITEPKIRNKFMTSYYAKGRTLKRVKNSFASTKRPFAPGTRAVRKRALKTNLGRRKNPALVRS